MELIFEVRDAEEGGYYARAGTLDLHWSGHLGWTPGQRARSHNSSLRRRIGAPPVGALHYVEDELMPVEAAW